MKKLFSLVAVAMMSASVFAAVQYCQEPITANDGQNTALLSLKHISEQTYAIELVAQGDLAFESAYNVNCGVNQTQGAGIYFANEKWVFSTDAKTASVEFETASAASVPTDLYGKYICLAKVGGGLVEFNLAEITDIDWTANCAEGPADTEAPVMGTATFVSATYSSVTLAVTATDNVAVKRYHVETTGVSKDFLPQDGNIVITGLTAGTTYTMVVTAKDAAGNVSANSATVADVQTLDYPAAPSAPAQLQANVRSIYSDSYTSALAHGFRTDNWGSTIGQEVDVEGNHYYVYNMTANVIIWGNNNDGDDAIIAADGFNDGTNKGLDLSSMENLHFDLWLSETCVGGVVLINDDRLGEIGALESGKWVSVDMPLSGLPADKLSNLRWMKFDGFAGVKNVFIDNVYAWKSSNPTALENVNGAQNTVKYIENGQLIIVRNGIRYNAMGQVTE